MTTNYPCGVSDKDFDEKTNKEDIQLCDYCDNQTQKRVCDDCEAEIEKEKDLEV